VRTKVLALAALLLVDFASAAPVALAATALAHSPSDQSSHYHWAANVPSALEARVFVLDKCALEGQTDCRVVLECDVSGSWGAAAILPDTIGFGAACG
jgi:hypothetical protein